MTKGLQSAARTICTPLPYKSHTCSLSCIFCQVHAPTENDQNPFAACGRQTLRGFFDTLRPRKANAFRGLLHAGMENINWNLAVQRIEQRSHSKNSPRLSVIPRQSAFLPWKSPSTRCHSEPVTDITGVRISRMKGTTYRFAPKIPPVYEQSMGGHRSPALFNREIPTAACAGSE